MGNFKYYTPTKVEFGKGKEEKVAKLIKEFGGSKVLIHYGKGSVVKSGLLDYVKDRLKEAEIDFVELGGVVPNPRLSLVREGIKMVKDNGVDFVLSVGGGSVIDSSKAICYGVMLPEDVDVWDIYLGKYRPKESLPLGVVLTLSATGSEMSDSSVITNEDGWVKLGANSDLCRPRFAIMNPEFTMTLPKYQTMAGATDIMMHTMERYFTNNPGLELSDEIAEGVLRTVMTNALILNEDPENYDARAEIMWAGSLSHNGLTGMGSDGGDWCCHKIEHELSGLYDVTHGAGLAAIWGTWARYVKDDCVERFYKFAVNVMGAEPLGYEEDDRTVDDVIIEGIENLELFFKTIGMPTSIKELNVNMTDDDAHLMAKKCADGCGGKKGAAKVLYEEDMYNIYKDAWDR